MCQLGCQVVKSCLLTTFHLLRNFAMKFASSLQCKSRASEPLKMSSRTTRRSSRSNKGTPPPPFDWTWNGKCWTVKSKQVVLPRQVGGSRTHITPRSRITKSCIPWAGNGLFLCQGISRAGLILAEYTGKVISIHEADHLRTLVRFRNSLER